MKERRGEELLSLESLGGEEREGGRVDTSLGHKARPQNGQGGKVYSYGVPFGLYTTL